MGGTIHEITSSFFGGLHLFGLLSHVAIHIEAALCGARSEAAYADCSGGSGNVSSIVSQVLVPTCR